MPIFFIKEYHPRSGRGTVSARFEKDHQSLVNRLSSWNMWDEGYCVYQEVPASCIKKLYPDTVWNTNPRTVLDWVGK